MRARVLATALTITLLGCTEAPAPSVEDCILQNVKSANSNEAVASIEAACQKKSRAALKKRMEDEYGIPDQSGRHWNAAYDGQTGRIVISTTQPQTASVIRITFGLYEDNVCDFAYKMGVYYLRGNFSEQTRESAQLDRLDDYSRASSSCMNAISVLHKPERDSSFATDRTVKLLEKNEIAQVADVYSLELPEPWPLTVPAPAPAPKPRPLPVENALLLPPASKAPLAPASAPNKTPPEFEATTLRITKDPDRRDSDGIELWVSPIEALTASGQVVARSTAVVSGCTPNKLGEKLGRMITVSGKVHFWSASGANNLDLIAQEVCGRR
jgi:hypothetical protein